MEKRVLFQEDMDVSPADFTNLQDFAQGSIDHLVLDAVTTGRRYAGFAAVQTGVTTVTVQPGRLISAGKVYAAAAVFARDFATLLPVAVNKIATIVVYGSEVDTDQQAREFLLDEDSGSSEPRVVALTRARLANVQVVIGQESADPIPPILDAGVLAIAQVVLTPTGIGSVTMVAENALDSVTGVAARTTIVEDFVGTARPKIAALSSDLASLTTAVAGRVDQSSIGSLLTRIATIEAKVGIPSTATESAVDFFNLDDASDPGFAGYAARVAEGLRFPAAASDTGHLAIQNALNPLARLTNGWLFPAYTRELRLNSGPVQGEIGLATYTYQAFDLLQKTATRLHLRYGEGGWYRTGQTSTVWWLQKPQSYFKTVFAFGDEALAGMDATGAQQPGIQAVRTNNYWSDTVEEAYWANAAVEHTIAGGQVAETFLNGSDQWLDAIGLTFTRLAVAGNATVAICETDRGVAVLDKTISVTTILRADMKLGEETIVPLQPVFLTGGKRYAIVVISAANHWLATTGGENFTSGTFFGVVDGAYQQGDATRDLCFSLYAAKFATARAVIELQPLQLAGGMVDLDFLANTVAPGSTDLTFEVNVNNAWTPIARGIDVSLNAGGALPPLVPLRAVFTGSPEVMPAIQLSTSEVTVARPATTLRHVSTARALPAPSTAIRVVARLEHFDAAHHTAVAKLRTGVGHATVVAASSFVDVALGNGAIERTWLFNLGAAVANYRIQIEGGTDNLLNLFHVAFRKDYAL
ncbi:MAG: hypothetical protein V4537_15970 [Pseudomonadota bacterium]